MSPVRTNVVAVVPCLNEARTVGPIISGLLSTVGKVIVVDDGSTDDTSSIACREGADVIRHESPQGKGASLAVGWKKAAQLGAEWVLLLDGDGQHDPSDAPSFFRRAEAGARLVVGDRMSVGASMPGIRWATNRWVSHRISLLAGQTIPDALCGYRLVHLASLRSLQLSAVRFEVESEMNVAFARAGFPLAFVPIKARYGTECSKISPIWDTLRWFRWYFRARYS